MTKPDFNTTILIDQSPAEVFHAINNPRAWWSEEIEGTTDQLNAVFNYHYKDVHVARMKVVEFIPDKKVVWLVLDNYFNFISDQREWVNTQISFEISQQGNQTQVYFTHIGLVPAYECHGICVEAWTNYINSSLKDLITVGKGRPNPKEEGSGTFNSQLLEKWKLQQH